MGARTFVALGSNLGPRREQLERAVRSLAATPGVRVLGVSSWHDTAPVGGPPGQPRYLNGVVEPEVELAPRALLERLLELEREAGRLRVERHGPRTLDLDLLLYGALSIDEPHLVVPHPELEQRAFVLAPLAELAPELALPRSGVSVRARLAELERG